VQVVSAFTASFFAELATEAALSSTECTSLPSAPVRGVTFRSSATSAPTARLELVQPLPVTLLVMSVESACSRYCTCQSDVPAGPVTLNLSERFPSFCSLMG